MSSIKNNQNFQYHQVFVIKHRLKSYKAKQINSMMTTTTNINTKTSKHHSQKILN